MKEKIKDLLVGLAVIAFGAVIWILSDLYVLTLFDVIKIDLRIVGGICAAVGVLYMIAVLVEKKPRVAAQTAPRTGKPAAPEAQPPQADVRAVVMAAREGASAESFRQAIHVLEPCLEADPGNSELTAGLLACYDGLLRTKGERTFEDYRQRFYTALGAVQLEERSGRKPGSRRFWAIYNAVHGGIAAASARDLDMLEDACFMLERAALMQSELSRDVDRQYMEAAVPGVRCWVNYWVARITATEKPDFERSAEALQLAAELFPREGDLRVCDMNPHAQTNTKTVLTWNNLVALRNHLMKVAGE